MSQIKIDESLDKTYKMYFRKDTEVMSNMFNIILSSLNLKQKIKTDSRLALVLSLKNPRFWDAFQIELANSSKRYQIGKLDLKADNITITEFGYLLSTVTNKPLILKGFEEDNTIHDWQIHYKFFDLMQSDLIDNYGIKIEEKERWYLIYLQKTRAFVLRKEDFESKEQEIAFRVLIESINIKKKLIK